MRRRFPIAPAVATIVRSLAAVLVLASSSVTVAGAQILDVLPPIPPYCEAGHSGEFNHGHSTASGSSYCLFREVLDSYVTPEGGWSPLVGTFTVVTSYFPSAPWGGPPFVANYPQVVLTYHRGNPRGYPAWEETLVGFGQIPNATGDGFVSTFNEIELVRVFDCEPTDFDCTYEIRPRNGTEPGTPPEWYRIGIEELVEGNNPGLDLFSFAYVAAGVGLVADGNQPPLVRLFLEGSIGPALDFVVHITATDADDDAITGYVVDWGDGTSVETALPEAEHTYADTDSHVVNVYARDIRGAVGFAQQSANTVFTVDIDGPTSVAVGEQIVFHQTLTNVGLTTVDLSQNHGLVPAGTVKLVSAPSPFGTAVPRGGSIEGTYVYDTLQNGTVTFHNLGASARPPGCPLCNAFRNTPEREVIIGTGISPTRTATPGAGSTPSPTATPRIPGLAEQAAAKLATKCQGALAKARSAAEAARLKGFATCGGKLSRCVQTKPDEDGCRDKAAAACVKVGQKLLAIDTKLAATIGKACAALATADLLAPGGLRAGDVSSHCPAPVTDLASLIDCVVAVGACTAVDLSESARPRLHELLTVAGSPLATTTCLDALGGGGHAGDAALGKTVDACQGAVAKAVQAFVAARSKGLDACTGAAMKCAQQKPDDEGCLGKAATACGKQVTARGAAATKLGDAMRGKCGAIGFDMLAAPSGLDFAALAPRCAGLEIPAVDTLDQLIACLERQAICTTDAAVAVAVPRAGELMQAAGQTFGESFCH